MGKDITGKSGSVSMNFTLWSQLINTLEDNGFTGSLPSGNDGDTVDKETAKQVGKAILKWWQTKSDASSEQPKLEPWESTILAYALLLAVDDGKAEHL